MSDSYAGQQLARALLTGSSHEDADTRRRADERAQAWLRVLDGIETGSLDVGSRTPVRGLPVWVTLEVLRGGFATGRPSAGGPLADDERERAERLGLEPTRQALFASWLTDAGLAELGELLDRGAYEIVHPENAALLVVAWLSSTGDRLAALELLDTIGPYADRLRFSPRIAASGAAPAGQVWRRTAGETRELLLSQRTPAAISAEREALTHWLPLTDRFVALWWSTRSAAGEVGLDWSAESLETAAELVAAYEAAALRHRLCRKYTDPKQNLPILVALTRDRLAGPLTAAQQRRAQHVTAAMVAKRGEPAGATLVELRAVQARTATAPLHRELARVAAARCAALPADRGIGDVAAVLAPVAAGEASEPSIPAGSAMPESVGRRVTLAASGSVEELVAAGVVPSAEVLAELIPALTAEQVGASYADPALGRVQAATYAAFRRRRSLLLLDLAAQARFTELPWLRATEPYAQHSRPEDPLRVARRVAALAIDTFPGTILPNPLIAELTTLYAAGGEKQPLTEELAADIFTGRFSDRFRVAAQLAGETLRGSLYARYYGVDYDEVLALGPTPKTMPMVVRSLIPRLFRRQAEPVPTFADLCQREVGPGSGWSVPWNGSVIERQQVITTHNLAALVACGGVQPTRSWFELAVAAATRSAELIALARRQPRPLATVKDAAYAWRQTIFFLTMAGEDRVTDLVTVVAATPTGQHEPLRSVLNGLTDIAARETFDEDGASSHGHRLLGWTMGQHWVLADR